MYQNNDGSDCVFDMRLFVSRLQNHRWVKNETVLDSAIEIA